MVNKAAVGLLGIVVVASLGVGILIGMQLGGTAPADDAVTDGTAATSGDDESDSTSADDSATPATATDRGTSIPARQFDEGSIADSVVEIVNDEREAADRSKLSTGGATAGTVETMADNHSVAMANYGQTVHEIDGVATHDRYENFGLADRCSFTDENGGYVWDPGKRQFADGFEAVGSTVAGQTYQSPDGQQFNGDEQEVARAVVDAWMADSDDRERILRNGPTLVGVGVEVTDDGTVYVTANVCA